MPRKGVPNGKYPWSTTCFNFIRAIERAMQESIPDPTFTIRAQSYSRYSNMQWSGNHKKNHYSFSVRLPTLHPHEKCTKPFADLDRFIDHHTQHVENHSTAVPTAAEERILLTILNVLEQQYQLSTRQADPTTHQRIRIWNLSIRFPRTQSALYSSHVYVNFKMEVAK